MVRRVETDPIDRDDRLGEAIEAYLALSEDGHAPDPEEFASGYPDLGEDLREALEGLALVQGLVGDPHGPGRGLESGRRIAGYRIVRELGRGGMGIVYEAVHVGLDRPVALKVLGSHAAPDSNGRRRFLNEARTAAGLHHTHIVPVFDVGQVGGLCYYAMQRIEGAGLDRVLRHLRHDRSIAAGSSQGQGTGAGAGAATPTRKTPTPAAAGAPSLVNDTSTWYSRGENPGRAGGLGARAGIDDGPPPFEPPRGSAYYRWVAEIGRQAAEALAHAHNRGIVHRDIKPSNLLVDARGIVWVADFGLARRLADPSLTQHDSLLGTPRYMSPEQARIGPIDGRSDIYSLGATLYELLTLRPPFEGRTAAELVEQISGREPAPPRRCDPRIPRDLETILLKTLAKRPGDRYATAIDLADDLKRFLAHEPVRARRISPIGRFWRFTRRHPSLTIVSATATAAVLATATVAYVQVLQERDKEKRASAAKELAMVEMRKAMLATEAANRATQGAMRELLLGQASLVELSNQPNRRVQGLDLLKKAAALGPDPALTARLRDQAIKFLMFRDVEARPGFATGATRGLVFAAEGTRLATIQESGEELTLWDVDGRRLLARPRLRPSAPANPDALLLPGNNRRPGSHDLVEVEQGLVAILPSRRGLRLLDAVTGELIRDLRTPDRSFEALFAAPGGDRLITVERIAGPGQGQGQGQGQPQGQGRGGRGTDPASGPGAGSEGGPRFGYAVNLWDPERWAPESLGQPIATLARWEQAHGSPLVALAPDGSIVATALSRTSTISFWSADDGEPRGETELMGELSALALGPDHMLAAASGGTIQLRDIASDTSLGQITPYHSNIRLLRFHPNGTLLAAVGMGTTDIELWDTDAQKMVALLPAGDIDRAEPSPPHGVDDLAFSPDGRTLVAAPHGATAPAWAVVEPAALAQLGGFDSWPVALALRDDGLLAIGSGRGAVWSWQAGHTAGALEQLRSGTRPGDASAATVAATTGTGIGSNASPAAVQALGGRPTSLAFDDRGRLLVLDPDVFQCWDQPPRTSAALRFPLPPAAAGSGGGFARMSLTSPPMARTPDGRTVFVARHSQILLWQSSRPDRLEALTLPGLPEPPDVMRDDHRRSGTEPGDPEHKGYRRGTPWWQMMAVAPDAARLYLIDNYGRLLGLALDADAGRARWLDWSPHVRDLRATTLALSPDGTTLAIGDRRRLGSVALIDTTRGIETARLDPATDETEGQIIALAFAPGGRELAVGTQQGLINLWSLDHRDTPPVHFPGHRGSIKALAFDPQGRHLASGGTDRTVAVWDLGVVREELGRLGLAW